MWRSSRAGEGTSDSNPRFKKTLARSWSAFEANKPVPPNSGPFRTSAQCEGKLLGNKQVNRKIGGAGRGVQRRGSASMPNACPPAIGDDPEIRGTIVLKVSTAEQQCPLIIREIEREQWLEPQNQVSEVHSGWQFRCYS